MAVVVGYGLARLRAVDDAIASAPSATVGLVQGDVENDDSNAVDPLPAYREATRSLLRDKVLDLIVWPETAAARTVREDLLSSFVSGQVFGSSFGGSTPRTNRVAPILLGLILDRSESVGRGGATKHVHRYFNSAVLASPSAGVFGTYDKRSLMMLGEYLPYEDSFPWLRAALPSAGKFSAGSAATVLPLGDRRLLPLICFEDLLADRVREDVTATEPDLLVNLTSDAWFGISQIGRASCRERVCT